MTTLGLQLNYIYYVGNRKYKYLHLLGIFISLTFSFIISFNMFPNSFYAETTRSFTDIFNTQSFRGSFEWIYKLDWLGGIMQMIISVFSIVGVFLICVRIISSLLYLSSKNIWDEVSDLKKTGGDNDLYDLGFIGQLKKIGQGKQGTGFDAILGFIFMFLPDIKRYSDFAEGKKDSLDEGLSVSQYVLKIFVPTVMGIFFFAMGFNGTLFQALGVTVEAMGTLADKAVSQDYATMLDQLVLTGKAYNFAIAKDGTEKGEYQYGIARDIYTQVLRRLPDYTTNQALSIGAAIEQAVLEEITNDNIGNGGSYGGAVKLTADDLNVDDNWRLLGYELVINTTPEYSDANTTPISKSLYEWAGGSESGITEGGTLYGEDRPTVYAHIYITQPKSTSSLYFAPSDETGTE